MRRNLILCLPCAQYKLEPTPEPSDEEESSSEEEEDAFGGKKKQVEDDMDEYNDRRSDLLRVLTSYLQNKKTR